MANAKLHRANQTAKRLAVEPVFYIMGNFGHSVAYLYFNALGKIEKTYYIDKAESYSSYLDALEAVENRYLEFKMLEVDAIMVVKLTEFNIAASFTPKDISDEIPTMKRLLEEKRNLELRLRELNDKIIKGGGVNLGSSVFIRKGI